MKFHKQVHLSNEERCGSCYPTVIACLLDLELDEVPHVNLLYFQEIEKTRNNINLYAKLRFLKGKEEEHAEEYEKENYHDYISLKFNLWDMVMDMFLASRGYYLDYTPDYKKYIKENPGVPYLVSGTSPRNIPHIVIYKDGLPYHDPHPSNAFLLPETEKSKYIYQALFNITKYNDINPYYISKNNLC